MSRLAIHPESPEAAVIETVRGRLDAGEVVAVPTDTIYGLAANAFNPEAVERVFALKGREAGKPLPVLVADLAMAAEVAASLPPLFFRLAEAFWPGPLTLIVQASAKVPSGLTAGTGSIGMRQPRAAIAAALLRACGYPLTATSANLSGQQECLNAGEVERQLGGRVELIVDGGPATETRSSTLVDLRGAAPRILRAGALPESALRELLG